MRKVLFIFGELGEDDLHWLVGSGAQERVPAGTSIIHEGRGVDRFYIVLDGELSVTVAALNGGEVARLAAGEVVGDMALLDSRPASATVTTTVDTRLYAIPHAALQSKLRTDARFASRFYRALCIFLANRLTATTTMYAKGSKPSLTDDVREEDELSPEVLDNVSLAGARFDWFVKRLRKGRSAMAERSIFRQKSLERLSTPDRLDELLRVVRRRSWLPLGALAAGLVVTVVWSFVGRIPLTAEGTAVLAHPRQVVAFQAPAAGQLLTLDVRIGDVVEKGQVLGTLNLPDIERQLDEQRAKLAQFQDRTTTMTSFEKDQSEKEKRFISRQRELMQKRVTTLREVAESVLAKNRAYVEEQRANVETTRELSKELQDALRERFESYQALKAEGLSSEDAVVNSRRAFIENSLRLAELDVSLQAVELRAIESEEAYLQQLDLISDLEIQIQGLELREAEIDRRILEDSLTSAGTVEDIQRTIARLEGQLQNRGRIVSEHAGRILEVTASVGTYVAAGQRLGALEAEDPDAALVTVAYFPVGEGKKVQAGMAARISPSTVQRERFGSIRGEVASVSAYPVTTDAAANQVGNREMAQVLTGGGNRIEVFAELRTDPDTYSGLQWTSSGGPDVRVTAGTTAAIRVTTEERAPITFVLPFLRSWLTGE